MQSPLAPVKGLHIKDVDVLAAKTHRVPSAATGGERIEGRYREGALLQDLDHGLTHGAAGTQYRYVGADSLICSPVMRPVGARHT